MTILDLYLVRHAESCGNIQESGSKTKNKNTTKNIYRKGKTGILQEPVLSIHGYIQSFYLKDYLEKSSIPYDKVMCSPLIRTVITAMVALSTCNDEVNNNVIHILPYLKFHFTKLSRINSVDELKEKIHNFKIWFHTTGIHIYQLFREIHPSSPKNVVAIHFPRIDYTLLEKYERRFQVNARVNIIDEFHEYIGKQSRTAISSLLVFTHKRFITAMTSGQSLRTVPPTNTSITKMTVNTLPNQPTFEIDSCKLVYIPSRVRSIKIKSEIEMCSRTTNAITRRRLRRRRIS